MQQHALTLEKEEYLCKEIILNNHISIQHLKAEPDNVITASFI
jgi:hypothetical protein